MYAQNAFIDVQLPVHKKVDIPQANFLVGSRGPLEYVLINCQVCLLWYFGIWSVSYNIILASFS